MTEIEVVRLQTHAGLLGLPKSEQDQQILNLIRGQRNPSERLHLMMLRELLQRRDPPSSTKIPQIRAARILRRPDVCAKIAGVQPIEGKAVKGHMAISVDVHSGGCGASLSPYAGPTPVRMLVHGREKVPPEEVGRLEDYLKLTDELKAAPLGERRMTRPQAKPAKTPEETPEKPSKTPKTPSKNPQKTPAKTSTKTPLELPGQFMKNVPNPVDYDWGVVLPIKPDSVSVLASPEIRTLAKYYYKNPASAELASGVERWRKANESSALQAKIGRATMRAEMDFREYMRVLKTLSIKLPRPVENLGQLERVLTSAQWKKISDKVKANRAFLEAQLRNKCPHVSLYTQIRRNPHSQTVLSLLQQLTETLEPGFKDVHDRWITCSNCSQPAICPHALREVTLTARGADESSRRKVLGRYEVKNSGGDGGGDISSTRACEICAEVLFYDTRTIVTNDRVSRTTMQDTDREAVHRELQIAAAGVRGVGSTVSLTELAEIGEDPVGRLYTRALAAIQRDRTATPQAIAARSAAALSLYVYAYVTSVVASAPGLEFAYRYEGKRPNDRELGFRLFLNRYTQLLSKIPRGDATVDQVGREAQGAVKPDGKLLRGQFKEAMIAVGSVRAPLREVFPEDEILANISLDQFFILLLRGRAEFDPKFSMKKFRNADSRKKFEMVVGAEVSEFVSEGGARPKRRLWKISPDWLPAGKGERWLRLWTGLTDKWPNTPIRAGVEPTEYRACLSNDTWMYPRRMRERAVAENPTKTLTRLGERRKFKTPSGAKGSQKLVDQFGKGFGATPADDKAALKAFAEKALQRAFFTMYTTRCPVEGAHEWRGTPPAPLKCNRCKLAQDDLYLALRRASSGDALTKTTLEYYRKFVGVSRVGEALDLPLLTLEIARTRMPPCGTAKKLSPEVDANRLGKRLGVKPRRILAIGTNDGLLEPQIEKTEPRRTRFAALCVRGHLYELIRNLEVLRTFTGLAVAPPWLKKLLEKLGASLATPGKLGTAAKNLPTLALDTKGTPASNLYSRWCATHKFSEADQHSWILSVYLAALAYIAESGKLGEAFARVQLERAVELSAMMLVPVDSDIRAYFSRAAQRLSAHDSSKEKANEDISELGLLTATDEDIHHGHGSAYEGENAENSELPPEMESAVLHN